MAITREKEIMRINNADQSYFSFQSKEKKQKQKNKKQKNETNKLGLSY
jgi:hypothetical protein